MSGQDEPVTFAMEVYQALGTASMCWSETPTGVFESERASQIGARLVALHEAELVEPGAVTVMREMIAVLEEHFAPLRSTLLDGTISCRECAALVLSENEERHRKWHASLT